jgi:hypothetical protein
MVTINRSLTQSYSSSSPTSIGILKCSLGWLFYANNKIEISKTYTLNIKGKKTERKRIIN